jgi:hypothetical protein
MNPKHLIGIAAFMLIPGLPRVSAEEIGGGQLVWLLLSEGVKQQFSPRSAPNNSAAQPRLPVVQTGKDAGACEVLQWDRKKFDKPVMGIFRPGKYCLDQDYEFECPIFNHGCAGQMIEIRASNVDLDFRGHTLRMSGTRGYNGVWGLGQNIRVHNGRIEGAGVAVTLMNRGASPGNAYPGSRVKTDDVFTDTGFVVEHMQFSDVLAAVEVAGSGNKIRDNTINAGLDAKVAGGPPFALLSYGPSACIERNTFHLHDLTPGSKGYAIYLRSADGTVDEDNTVRVGDTLTGTIGVGLSNSKDVSLRRNRFDTEKSTELDERSNMRQ